jgi:hypothetical protein
MIVILDFKISLLHNLHPQHFLHRIHPSNKVDILVVGIVHDKQDEDAPKTKKTC